MIARIAKPLVVLAVVISAIAGASCKGDDPSAPQNVIPPGPTGNDDFITQAVDGGAENTHIEASGLPNIDCDPRVDWGASQVVLWHTFTNGSGPNGYDHFFEIMFPAVDTVGTYTVHGDFLQALFYDGTFYTASPLIAISNGTVEVTRSDTRIEGTYMLTVIDSAQTDSLRLSGQFGVEKGFSLSCP